MTIKSNLKVKLHPTLVQGLEAVGGQQDSDGSRANEHLGQVNAPEKNQGSGMKLSIGYSNQIQWGFEIWILNGRKAFGF